MFKRSTLSVKEKRGNTVGTHRELSHVQVEFLFTLLGTKIVEMPEFTKGKLDAHQAMKNMVRVITEKKILRRK